MITRYRISVGGVQLDSLDDRIAILDIGYETPEREIRQYTTANLDGIDIREAKITRRRITVTLELHVYDTKARNALCQAVNAWAAAGGVLKTDDREDQRLIDVICSQYIDIDSVKDWTKPLSLVFTTTHNAYWLSDTEVTRTLTGKNVTGIMTMDGNTSESLVSVTATAQAAVTAFKATVGDTTLELTGLNVANGQTIVIDYVRNRYLRIRANGSNVQSKLKATTSSDNLKAKCGMTSSIGIVADGKVTAVFKARGCWR